MYLINPPKISAKIKPTRDYAQMLQKTRLVYDQLLAQKAMKLMKRLHQHKDVFDRQCGDLEKVDPDKALECAIEAQEKLTNMQRKAEELMIQLFQDYQNKFNNMHQELEAEWEKKQQSSSSSSC